MLAFSAASFVTNTNWQSYSGVSATGHLVQMAGLAVHNFVSAAVGIAVVLVAAGAVQNLHGVEPLSTIAGGHQQVTGGPAARPAAREPGPG